MQLTHWQNPSLWTFDFFVVHSILILFMCNINPQLNLYLPISVGHGKCSGNCTWTSIRREAIPDARHLPTKIMDRRALLHHPPTSPLHIHNTNPPPPRPRGVGRLHGRHLLPLVHPDHLRTCLLHISDVPSDTEQEHHCQISCFTCARAPHFLFLVTGEQALIGSSGRDRVNGDCNVDSHLWPVCFFDLWGVSWYLEGLFDECFPRFVACDQAVFVFGRNCVVRAQHFLFRLQC